MSSCSLNNKEKNFIDKFAKIKNFKNVHVMDASVLPTTLTTPTIDNYGNGYKIN